MVYTEVRNIKEKKYYYRVVSIRKKDKTLKKRVYLGNNLSELELVIRERIADKKLLSVKQKKVNKEIKKIKAKIVKILKKNKIKKAGIFGSYATGKQRKNSDVDILIKYPKGMGLGFVGIALDLEKVLKKKVDLLTYNGISPYLKKYILESEIRII